MPLLFAVTLFVSASLLFMVQPMVGKMVLPLLGGTPAVWNTCMVFFQAVLLVGYAYTHTLSTTLSRRRQLLIGRCHRHGGRGHNTRGRLRRDPARVPGQHHGASIPHGRDRHPL